MSCGLKKRILTEKYDPNGNVCDNQGDFNTAFRQAIEHNNKENVKKAKPWIYVYAVLWSIFLIWSIFLAMQVSSGNERISHLILAIVFSPVYVLAYYIGAIGKGAVMGMKQY